MKIVVVTMIAMVLFLVGCTTPTTVPPISVPEEELVTRFIPVSEVPKIFNDRTVVVDGVEKIATTRGSDGTYPPEIKMEDVGYGDELSTWTGSVPELGIKNGEPLALYIFNRTGGEVTYNISYQTPDKVLKDDDGKEYQPSIAAVFWVELSDRLVTVPPETVAIVSARIVIPEKNSEFSLLDRWAFQLYIYPIQNGNVQRAYLQNWLIGMK